MPEQKVQQIQIQKITPKQQTLLENITSTVQGIRQEQSFKDLTLFTGLLSLAVIGRIAFQFIPSVEPIIPLAILAAFMLGPKEGFMLGGSAYIVSNFFIWGLQGPWTVFQALGGAIPAALIGFLALNRNVSPKYFIVATLAATVFFEVVMNASGPLMGLGAFGLLSIPLYFLTSLPFTLTHLATNAGFAFLFSGLLKNRRKPDAIIKSITRTTAGNNSSVRMYQFK